MRSTVLLFTTAVLVFVVGVYAQGKTDFSGRWQLRDPAKAGSDTPRTLEIAQTADALKISATDKKITRNYKLDGSESKNEPFGKRPEGSFPGTYTEASKATWKGAALVIHTESTNGDVGGQDDTTYRLDGRGRQLTIDIVATFSTGAESKTQFVYDKVTNK